MYRRTVLSGLVGGTALLAGCIGEIESLADGDDAGDGEDGATTVVERRADETGTEPVETGSAGEVEGETWRAFEFDRAARYEFAFFAADEGEGRLVLDVEEVAGDQVTVSVDYDGPTDQYQSTITGDAETVQGQLLFTPAGSVITLAVFSPTMSGFAGEELEVGTEWSYSSPEGSMRYAVTGTDAYAGVDCYATVVEMDGQPVHESCLAPAHGLAVYTAYYEDDGSTEFEIELVGYEPR